LILVPSLLFLVAVPFRLGPATGLLCCFNTAATVWAYMLAAYSDPGIQVKQARLEEPAPLDGLVPCSRCSIYRSPHTVHCLMCDVCIAGLDHHCPWVGKCIGASTLRYFYIWVRWREREFVEVVRFVLSLPLTRPVDRSLYSSRCS
jgi:hypothetical protein